MNAKKIILKLYSLNISYLNRKILHKLMKKQFESTLLREIYRKFYDIDIGMYSYGCFNSAFIPKGTKIGRYCSFGPDVKIFNANHPIHFASSHPYLYNVSFGLVKEEKLKRSKLVIEDDVWLGANIVILPQVTKIGTGAVIGAGSIVTKNIPEYAVVAGNPAKIIKYRFNQEKIDILKKSKIYALDKKDFIQKMKYMYDEKDFKSLL